MSYGTDIINGACVTFGFADVKDWLASVILSFPAPWSLAQRKGKYYGTVILDARGVPILSFWEAKGDPSEREKEYFGAWTQEAWDDHCCDSHWESANTLTVAEHVIIMRNAEDDASAHILVRFIVDYGSWEDSVFREIACGGPLRRNTKSKGGH